LSAPLVELGKNAIAQIPGAPPWDNCKVESAPPPPPPSTAAPSNTTAPPNNTTGDDGGQTSGGGTTPDGGTVAPGATPSNGTVASGGPLGGSGSSGSGSQSSGGQTSGGAQTQQTVVSVDPETGETVVVTVPLVESETGCVDPITGLPAQCGTGADGEVSFDAESSGDGAAAPSGASPPAVNPPISDDDSGPGATRIVWWLLQGAGVCGVGVALAGARRRFG
jgi:hypothetical protein